MQMKQEITKTTTEVIAGSTASKFAYGGAGTAIIFGVTANELAAYAGIIIGLLTLAVNIYYKHKNYKLAERRLNEELNQNNH